MLRVVSIVLVLFATASHAGSQEAKDLRVVEHWRCYSPSLFDEKNVLVEALRFEVLAERVPQVPSTALGVIKVAGMAYQALFYVDGFDRTWTFGPGEELIADKTPPFMFVVRPDGDGLYYDFSGGGRQTYECEVVGAQGPADETGAEGPRGPVGAPCTQRPEVTSYISRVRSRVLSRWRGGSTGSVELQFTIDAAGAASNIELISATNPELGEAITEAMRVASPFEPMSSAVQCLAGETLTATFNLRTD